MKRKKVSLFRTKTLRKLHLRRYTTARNVVAILIVFSITIIGLGVYTSVMTAKINPKVYTPLLNTIAKGESKGNYNAYFGNTTNSSIRFTDMTIAEVLQWQESYVKQGSVSSAVGKYQIIRPTLLGLTKELELDHSEVFNEALQDRMAVALLERRGAADFARQKLSREQFAANLAKEWAALPKIHGPNPEQSYYAGDGINKAQLSVDEVYRAMATIQN